MSAKKDNREVVRICGQTFHAHSQLIGYVFVTLGPTYGIITNNNSRRAALPLRHECQDFAMTSTVMNARNGAATQKNGGNGCLLFADVPRCLDNYVRVVGGSALGSDAMRIGLHKHKTRKQLKKKQKDLDCHW
jgi:hypothetical protein